MEQDPPPRPALTGRPTLLYGTLVTALVTWQSVTFSGVVQWLGEWQFARVGRFFPVTTIMALLLVAALPVLGWSRWRRRGATTAHRDALALAISRSRRAGSLYALAASCLAIAAAVVLAFALPAFLPQGPTQILAAADPRRPVSGPVQLTGFVDRSRVLRIREDAIVVGRTVYVAPLVGYPGDRSEVRYFVPIYPRSDTAAAVPDPTAPALTRGYLRVRGMPDEAANLLRAQGYSVSRRAALLYRTPAEAAWSGLVTGLATALLALVFAAGAVTETRRHRRLAAAAQLLSAAPPPDSTQPRQLRS